MLAAFTVPMPGDVANSPSISNKPCRFRGIIFRGKGLSEGQVPAERASKTKVEWPKDLPDKDPKEAVLVRKVLRVAGLHPGSYRSAPLIRRVPACLRTLRVGTPEAAALALAQRPESIGKALNALLIGTTSFFRDAGVFAYLERVVVPDALRREDSPRVLSVACSDGAELYSVAMLFAEHGVAGEFLGTDCRPDALAAAQTGAFPRALGEEIPPHLGKKHVTLDGRMLKIRPHLRARTRWRQADILRDAPDGQWDVILCRNLAIYLTRESSATLWERLFIALAPGGALVVGKAERIHHPGLQRVAPCVYRKIPPPCSARHIL